MTPLTRQLRIAPSNIRRCKYTVSSLAQCLHCGILGNIFRSFIFVAGYQSKDLFDECRPFFFGRQCDWDYCCEQITCLAREVQINKNDCIGLYTGSYVGLSEIIPRQAEDYGGTSLDTQTLDRVHSTFYVSQITVKPDLQTTCIKRPSAYKDRLLQVPRCMLSMLLNLHNNNTCV